MSQRNSLVRKVMLAGRSQRQAGRAPGFTQMHRKPRAHIGKWDPTGDWSPLNRDKLVPAWMNRRTIKPRQPGRPHEHARAKARRLRQVGAS